jgi:hypothetical protein
MFRDSIVEEVRKAREEYAKQFNFNLRDMIADLQRRQRESGRKTVSFPPKRRPMAADTTDRSKTSA